MKRAIVTGVTGQDGSYLTELLLEKNYRVDGIWRRSSNVNTQRLNDAIRSKDLILHYGDLAQGIDGIIHQVKPHEIYNMASQSQVRISFEVPVYTLDIGALGPVRILEAIRRSGMNIRYYQASSSEMFGESPAPQDEDTPMLPQSPYGVAKLAAYRMTQLYRKGYGLFASNGILFNHESPRRGENFLTKKIVRAAVRIKMGKQKEIRLGHLNTKRDWGHSKDYMEAVYAILQHDTPDDFVVATGKYYSGREFAERVFGNLDLNFDDYMVYDPTFDRVVEVPELRGNSTKIKKILGWESKCTLDDLIDEMISQCMAEEANAVNS